jgi:peptidoglycan L-alanyl-D-glutamate endopeptidase CwlK
MKKYPLGFPFLVVLCIVFSAPSTVTMEGATYFSSFLSNDTLRSTNGEDTTANAPSVNTALEPWKQWATVQNFTFGKDRGNLPMIADLNSLHPYFRDRIYQLINNCRAKGIELAIVESYRTHAKQHEYFTMGRKYTRSKGGKSKHQYGLAVDVVPIVDSVAVWDNVILWRKIGVEGEKLGLRWGGRWKSPYDPAHFEWSGGLTTVHLSSGALPAIPPSFVQKYPCIKHDIEELKEHWEMWEVEQSAVSRNATKGSSIATAE